MREKILSALATAQSRYPGRMLIVILLITLILMGLAGRLTVSTRMSDLLPEKDPRVVEFNKILDEFVTATNLVIVVQGEEEKIKNFADNIVPRILALTHSADNEEIREEIGKLEAKLRGEGEGKKKKSLQKKIDDLRDGIDKKLFQRVDYKTDTSFLKQHALMLIKSEDLENIRGLFTDMNLTGLIRNINNSMEKEYVGKEESISTREKEENAFNFLDGIENLVKKLHTVSTGGVLKEAEYDRAVEKLLFGEPYFLSYDKTALILTAIPNFSLMERGYIMKSAEQAHALMEELQKEYPDIRAGLSGQIAREYDEQIYSEKSLGFSTLLSFAAILAMLMVSFRMWVAPVLALANLFIGLIWALGITFLMVGELNMFTAMMSVVLLGLGIDFSIHIISGFTERIAAGDDVRTSLVNTFLMNGKGVITGAVTTSFAFFSLMISSTKGMKEMGLVTATGLIMILVTTLVVLPVFLVIREKYRTERLKKKGKSFVARDISFKFLGRFSAMLGRRHWLTISVALMVTALMLNFALKMVWDWDFRNMEPEGLESIELMDTIMDKFDLSMEYGMILTDSVQESKEIAEKFRDLETVAVTSDISLFLPTKEEQEKRVRYIDEIRQKISSVSRQDQISGKDMKDLQAELERLQMNIMEMQDMAFIGGQDKVDNKCKRLVGDPDTPEIPNLFSKLIQTTTKNLSTAAEGFTDFQKFFAPKYRDAILRMCDTSEITLNDLPDSILQQYCNKNLDKFLVTIYPAGDIYNGVFMNRFVDGVSRVDPRTTGMPSISVWLMRILGKDGRNAIILTLSVVFILLWIDFRKPLYALMAMVPLAFGIIWMVGIMYLAGIKLNMMNIMGLPLIIGIGIDDGVHLIHRWRYEGTGKLITVFSSTGKAVLLTTLTTMLAFGSMIFSAFPAWGSFGGSLFIGVAACFLASVTVLPGIIGFLEGKK